ncbi:ABC transporter G family member 23 isoform X2 [Solanum lycopersicum]|uniref:ABC transporter G family member 23 isoform X2 n=1 Tax=Solanum lycopersicum TaxID=4081 RepID=UPI000532A9D7|nr:ABC transporter G family member 23 isoform X2 [Solanum lycopersicum]
MASPCTTYHPSPGSPENDSMILFSTSTSCSPAKESTITNSNSSSFDSSSPPQSSLDKTYELRIRNLSYTISPNGSIFSSLMKKSTKPKTTILKSVSFVAGCSGILAIVGPSGTGKSTLLRVISGRVSDKEFDPKSIYLNDHAVTTPAQLRNICGYVAQEDNLLPLLTVKETLMFSAKFRLRGMSSKEREERVESLMQELDLDHVANNFVGDEEKRGISGGERKRVSIGVDMIHDPSILLLDEPTSGLDSSSALQVIELLSSMAKTKQRMVHYGSLQSLEENITRMGYEIPIQLNPLEFAMETISVLENQEPHYKYQSCSYLRWEEAIIQDTANKEGIDQAKVGAVSNKHCSSLFEIAVLCSRFWKIIYRTKQLFLARTMQALVGGFGLGSVYIKMRNDEGAVAERLGLFAFSLSFLLSSTVEALPIYLQERRVIMKEASRGAYKISSYMIANTIIFLPFLFAVAILFAVPVYWIVGLNPSITAFVFFTFVVWVIVLMASSLVLFLSAISPDFISGNSLICTVLGAFFLFSGYFIPKECIPKYWIFMYYVSLYRYPLDALLTNEYWSLRHKCFTWNDENHSECLLTGNDVLKNRGLDKDTRWMNVGIMLAFFVFYRVISWIVLARKASKTTI